MLRLRAETMPAVTVEPIPKGSPIAITQSPIRALSLSPKWVAGSGFLGVTFSSARSVLGSRPTTRAGRRGAILQDDGDLVAVLDHMIVGDDIALTDR